MSEKLLFELADGKNAVSAAEGEDLLRKFRLSHQPFGKEDQWIELDDGGLVRRDAIMIARLYEAPTMKSF
jgi:hypothetical protein